MLEVDLDNLDEALKFHAKGLEICDEEEVVEDDDGRSRLHHNLGNVYMELRRWGKAREHIEKDIMICKRIGHCQGEGKGYINLGELHYRVQSDSLIEQEVNGMFVAEIFKLHRESFFRKKEVLMKIIEME
ncbi:hypothetical protein J1N35_007826 [Gossypium stocksii]|uniref:MalT-like TPR region domain-containing protein n=1 Tax=Gossypium stocksii TaxID=47602 RepID=A0A9D4AFY5_9ROSI|nr:hypothetical protein J1N35_007826 [Gossypium stocksii]